MKKTRISMRCSTYNDQFEVVHVLSQSRYKKTNLSIKRQQSFKWRWKRYRNKMVRPMNNRSYVDIYSRLIHFRWIYKRNHLYRWLRWNLSCTMNKKVVRFSLLINRYRLELMIQEARIHLQMSPIYTLSA
jgi:hypothetical protein